MPSQARARGKCPQPKSGLALAEYNRGTCSRLRAEMPPISGCFLGVEICHKSLPGIELCCVCTSFRAGEWRRGGVLAPLANLDHGCHQARPSTLPILPVGLVFNLTRTEKPGFSEKQGS